MTLSNSPWNLQFLLPNVGGRVHRGAYGIANAFVLFLFLRSHFQLRFKRHVYIYVYIFRERQRPLKRGHRIIIKNIQIWQLNVPIVKKLLCYFFFLKRKKRTSEEFNQLIKNYSNLVCWYLLLKNYFINFFFQKKIKTLKEVIG